MGKNISSEIIRTNESHGQLHYTHKVKEIMNIFFISPDDLKLLFSFFNKIDNKKKGYIALPSLYLLIKESPNKSEVSPFLDHLFNIVEKKFHDQITFEEFLPFLVSFCISSKYQIIQFVFNLIDTDHNKYISRGQIIDLYSAKRNNENLFFINHPKRIKEYSGKSVIRSDKLSIDDFATLCSDLPFVYFPAVQLQKKLRNYYISERFWHRFENHIRKEYIENITKKEDLKLQVNIADIRNKVIDERIKNFKKRWEK